MRRLLPVLLALLPACAGVGPTAAPAPEPSDLSSPECRVVSSPPAPCPQEDDSPTSFSRVQEGDLDCPPEQHTLGSYGYEGGGKPGAPDATDGTRMKYDLQPRDQVEETGPDDGESIIRIRRGDALIGIVHWEKHRTIGWLPDAFAVCDVLRLR